MTAFDKDMRDPRRDEVIAGEYVLGALSAEDRRKVERRLARDRRFAAMVSRWERNLAASAEEEAIAFPLPAGRPVVGLPRDAALSGPWAGFWNSLGFWRALAVASLTVAAATALSTGALFGPRPAGEAGALDLVVHYDGEEGVLRLATAAASGAADATLALWLVGEKGAPVSLGTLPRAAEDGRIAVPESIRHRLVDGAALLVSAEPRGRLPADGMTGPIVASATLRALP